MIRPFQQTDFTYHPSDLAAINSVATAVGKSLELGEVLRIALDTVIELFGVGSGGIYLVDKPGGRLKMHTHRNLTKPFLKEKSLVSWGEGCAGQAATSGDLYAAFGNPGKVFVCKDSERLMGLDCLVAVPLKSKGNVLGVLELFAPASRRLTEREARVINSIASQIGVAVDNATLYQQSQATVRRLTALQKELTKINRKLESHLREESYIARTLQQSLLPADIPEVAGLDLGTFYGSATRRASVGGDFYDVFLLSEKLVCVVGDVCGKGIEVASQAAAVKYSIRSYLAACNEPCQVLEAANRTLIAQRSLDVFATVSLLIVDPKTMSISYSSAGHPPPLHYRSADKSIDKLRPGGPALGVSDSGKYRSFSAQLAPGDSLAVYTDGLTDARKNGMVFGCEGIMEALTMFRGSAAQLLADRIARRCLDFAGGELQDDIAILVLKSREKPPRSRKKA